MAKILCIDFDGVLHAYTSGWQGADRVDDGPVDGAMAFLVQAAEYFEVNIYSSRSGQQGGIAAMQKALTEWHIDYFAKVQQVKEDDEILRGILRGAAFEFVAHKLKWPFTKPGAFLSIDDRALRFDGTWPRMDELSNYKTWQGR